MKMISPTAANDIKAAYDQWQEIDAKYHTSEGSYDRTHGHNVALGRRWAKLLRRMNEAGLTSSQQLTCLSILSDNQAPHIVIQRLRLKFNI